MQIDRGFVRIREGPIHYRSVGTAIGEAPPLWMIHAPPASCTILVPGAGSRIPAGERSPEGVAQKAACIAHILDGD